MLQFPVVSDEVGPAIATTKKLVYALGGFI